MSRKSKSQSVFDEPHLQGSHFSVDPSEKTADATIGRTGISKDQAVEHTVWDEPALSGELVAEKPADALSYSNWLSERIRNTSISKSWIITFLLVLAAAPWAVGGVFLLSLQNEAIGGTAVIIFAPVLEEMLKISAPLMTLEKRPYLFKSPLQIFICCAMSGLTFAFIENMLYLHVYISNPTPLIVLWRWTACVMLHAGCTTISSLGMIKMWKESVEHLKKPQMHYMMKYVVTACIIHGTYNLTALLIDPLFR